MSANRIVAFLTPVFVAGSALLSGYVAKTTGLNVSPAELVSVETTVGVAAAASAIKWLHGWSVYEKVDVEAKAAVAEAEKFGVTVPSEAEIEASVEKHVGSAVLKLAAAIPQPPILAAKDPGPPAEPAAPSA